MVSRSGRWTGSLSLLGRQGLVGSNFAQSERAPTIARPCRRRNAAAGRPVLRDRAASPTGRVAQPAYGQSTYGQDYGSSAYANYQELEKKKSPVGWWIAGAALVIGIIIVAVIAIRAVTGGDTGTTGGPVAQPSQDACPAEVTPTAEPSANHPADGRVHGGPVSYPQLGSPWGAPQSENRVPFGSDVQTQMVPVETNYDGNGSQLGRLNPGRRTAGR